MVVQTVTGQAMWCDSLAGQGNQWQVPKKYLLFRVLVWGTHSSWNNLLFFRVWLNNKLRINIVKCCKNMKKKLILLFFGLLLYVCSIQTLICINSFWMVKNYEAKTHTHFLLLQNWSINFTYNLKLLVIKFMKIVSI